MNNKTFTKAYLVEFTDKRDGYSFLKFGATNDYDVTKRFEYEPEQYKNYDIRVIGSIYANQNNVNYKRMGEVEEYFLSKYPRNTKYFKNNFSGISETYQPANEKERKKMISEFYDVRTMILDGKDIKDISNSTVNDIKTNILNVFDNTMKKNQVKVKSKEPLVLCDCMFGCSVCKSEPINCDSPDPADWH